MNMKKIVLLLGISGVLFLYSACENDAGSECKYCKEVRTSATGTKTDGVEKEYCLEKLDSIKSKVLTDPDGNKTQWECR
jgi:hypothetical protein